MTIQELINRLRHAFSPNAITPEALGYILQAIYNLIIAKDNLIGDKVPTSTDGVDGNFYFDKSAKILYIKANGAWIPIISSGSGGTPIVIAQEEGNSLDIVMSQNAVSTLLETIRQSIIDKVSPESLNDILADYVSSITFNAAINNLANTYVAKEVGKSLIEDVKIEKLDALPSSVFSQVETQQAINTAIAAVDTNLQEQINTHESQIQDIVTAYIDNKGYFATLPSLEASHPPEIGDTAYVADALSSTGYYIYNVVDGIWTSSTVEAPPVAVPIGDYILKTNVKQDLGDSETDIMSQKSITEGLDSKIDKTSITQDLGTSETDVMSQKVVTDEIAQLADNASVKIKNLVVNGDFNSSEGWTTTAQGTIVDGELVITTLNSPPWKQNINASIGDKVYFGGVCYTLSGVGAFNTPFIMLSDGISDTQVSNQTATPTKLSQIRTIAGANPKIRFNEHYAGDVDQRFDKIFAINLTTTFGAGNEPTKEEFELLLATLGIDYFEGEITIPAQKVMQWQLKSIRENKNEKAAHGYTDSPKTLKQVDDVVSQLAGNINIANITNEYPLPPGTFYTWNTANQAIPLIKRRLGKSITFLNADNKWENWQFTGLNVSGQWSAQIYWKRYYILEDLTINTLDSAYHLGTYIINKTITEVVVKAIKQVEFPYNVDNRKFYFSLVYRSGTEIIIQLCEYVDGVSTEIYYQSVAAVTGLNVYYLTTLRGIIRLTANFDEITSSTLASPPPDPTTCFFNAITYSRPESELPKIIQKSFGVFNPGVFLPRGYNDVTNQVISSILSVEMSGDWHGRKFIFTYLSIKEGKIIARFSEVLEDGTIREVYSSGTTVEIDYNILDPIGTAIFDRNTTVLAYKNNLVFKLVIDNSKLPTPDATGLIFMSRTPSDETFERMGIANEKIVDGNMPSTKVHNTIADMKKSESISPIQFAGNLPYKLTDKTLPHPENAFSPMWNAIKGVNRKPNVETKVLTPPTVVGHNNTLCVLQEIGLDDTFYIAGTGDKTGRIYTSTDGGETITEIYDLRNILGSNEGGLTVWCIKELPSRELLVAMTVSDLTTTEEKTKLFITSENKTVWNRVTKPDLSEFTLTYYKEVDSEDNITFEVYGMIINGWGYSAWRDYVLLVEYGYNSKGGASTQPNVDGVGHMVTGKMYLSEDGGITFREIFDYINPPENIIFNTYPGGHHSHGGFIDQYHLTNGVPRLVGIMGDANNRLVYSDDLGETWEDNWSSRNGTQQSVSGMATPYGYLTLPDNAFPQNRNGVQLIHRGNKWEGMHSDLVCNFMRDIDYTTYDGTNHIVYVGGNIFQRSPNSPILACYTPEANERYNSGARGGAVISFDGGITWEEIWRDTEVGWLRAIQYTMIWETSDGTIWLAPSALWGDNLDGLGDTGRVLKITL